MGDGERTSGRPNGFGSIALLCERERFPNEKSAFETSKWYLSFYWNCRETAFRRRSFRSTSPESRESFVLLSLCLPLLPSVTKWLQICCCGHWGNKLHPIHGRKMQIRRWREGERASCVRPVGPRRTMPRIVIQLMGNQWPSRSHDRSHCSHNYVICALTSHVQQADGERLRSERGHSPETMSRRLILTRDYVHYS